MKHKNTRTRSAARPRLTPDGFEPGQIVSRKAFDDLSARFAPSSYNSETRTVEAIFSAGSRVSRWGVHEELEISAEAIDLNRVALGQVRLLDTHNQNSLNAVLGVVENARIEGGNLVGRIRFADTEAGRNAEGMVARGELTGISVGYRVTTWVLASLENEVEVWRAARWELLEVSLVAVPADPQASIRSTAVHTQRADEALAMENDDMRRNAANPTAGEPAATLTGAALPPDATRTAPAPTAPAVPEPTRAAPVADFAAERARSAEILSIGTRAAMSHDDISSAINAGTSVDAFRARAFDAMANAADRTRSNNVSVGQDETETRMRNMTDAFAFRLGGVRALGTNDDGTARVLSGEARAFTGFTLAEMAATVLGSRSMPRTSADREDVLRRAMHTTSDFPVIFESTLNRVLASRYAVQAPTYRAISARRNFRDFRPHDQVRVGDFPSLKPVGESGEIKFGSFGDSKETVAVAPYAIQFAISRRMLIDDNIGAIDQVLGSYGDGVARFEENTFYAMKALNGGNGPSLNEGAAAVFHTAKHFNLAATGTIVNPDALSLGRAAMRKQKNQSGALINARPRILLVGADQETNADKSVAVITPTAEGDVNPFGGKLSVVVGPYDGNGWELYASPDELPVWVWGMLDGYEAPRMRIENPFGVQGVGVSLEHDFGCGAIDFRGGYRNPGQ
jgi:HK97 family phage prohead protease